LKVAAMIIVAIIIISVLLLILFFGVTIAGGRAHDRANEEAAGKKRDISRP
jgi:type II secretory pathway pseudopilin PulG